MTPTDERKSRRFAANPLFIIAISFAAGIVAARAIDVHAVFWLIAACGAAVLAVTAIRERLRGIIILAAFLLAGGFSFEALRISIPENDLGRMYDAGAIADRTPVLVTGSVVRPPEASPDGFYLKLNVTAINPGTGDVPVAGAVRVFAPNSDDGNAVGVLRMGDGVKAGCELTRANEFRNPGATPRREILDSQGIDATCSLKRGVLPEIQSRSDRRWLSLASDARIAVVGRFAGLFEPRTAGVLTASLLGNKHFLDRDTGRLFREGGTFHILVISGLHVTVIGGLILFFVRRITRRRLLQFLVSAGLLWMFAFAVGGEVPVVRAAMMFTAVLFARVLYRKLEPLNGLGLCALLLLVLRPDEVFDRSFQMTFLSMCALVGFAFPMLAKLRSIGEWRPDPRTPFPPVTDRLLRIVCETFYWRDETWKFESEGRIWSAAIFKTPISQISSRPFIQKTLRWIFEGAVVSLIMQIWMLPVSALYFNRVSYSAVATNLWVSVFIAAESVLAIVAVVVASISESVARPLVVIVERLNGILLWLPDMLYAHDLAGTRVPAYDGFGVVVYYLFFVPLIVLAVALARWNPVPDRPSPRAAEWQFRIVKLSVATLICFSFVMTMTPFSKGSPNGRLHVDFIDVGQGDSALVTFPDGTTMLVDGGGRPDFGAKSNSAGPGAAERFEPDRPSIGETVVSRFLWTRGISRIDYVVATHADADHIEGLVDIAANFRIGMFLAGRFPEGDVNFTRLRNELDRRSVPVYAVGRGDSISVGRSLVEFLHPVPSHDAANSGGNNQSVVLRIAFGARRILMTGDIERESERELAAVADLRADVVKVAHHGSRTSSTAAFVESTKAAFAIFPVGSRSPYGHPHADVVERWRKSGAQTLTTGECGTLTVSTDGSELRIERFVRPP